MCTDFFSGMVDVLKENSGYSGAKIHFTDQWTYDLWFKNSETGEYEKTSLPTDISAVSTA